MRKVYILILFVLSVVVSFSCDNSELYSYIPEIVMNEEVVEVIKPEELYEEMELEEVIDYQAFEVAVTGYNNINDKKKEVLTIIDFTKPSTEERMFVINMEEKELVMKTHVLHGRNSGDKYATSFSNKVNSYKSSLGFFLTDNTYHGKYGYALRIDGLEQGINSNARDRAIVVHASKYADPSRISSFGKLGRSLGCPAVPPEVSKPLIDVIKEGSVMYIHADDSIYMAQSTVLNDHSDYKDVS